MAGKYAAETQVTPEKSRMENRVHPHPVRRSVVRVCRRPAVRRGDEIGDQQSLMAPFHPQRAIEEGEH